MTDTKHTPGPWFAETDEFDVADVISAEGWLVAENTGANAHLIAAAPELLEALEGCISDLERHARAELEGVWFESDFDSLLSPYRAAIAKARGEVK